MVTAKLIYADGGQDQMELVEKGLTETGKRFKFRLRAQKNFSPSFIVLEEPGKVQYVQSVPWSYYQVGDIFEQEFEVGDDWGK